MSTIVTCSCGSKVRIPDSGAQVRCPRCKQPLSAPEAARPPTLTSHAAASGEAGSTCPICQTGVAVAQPVVNCPTCNTVHHDECWQEVGGCGTYGCESAPAPIKAKAAGTASVGWGDVKICPCCGQTIRSIALMCRYCRTVFDTTEPLTRKEYFRLSHQRGVARAGRVAGTMIFILSLVGCIGPLMLGVNIIWVFVFRERVERAGPVFKIMGIFGLVLTLVYSLLMGGFAIWEFAVPQ